MVGHRTWLRIKENQLELCSKIQLRKNLVSSLLEVLVHCEVGFLLSNLLPCPCLHWFHTDTEQSMHLYSVSEKSLCPCARRVLHCAGNVESPCTDTECCLRDLCHLPAVFFNEGPRSRCYGHTGLLCNPVMKMIFFRFLVLEPGWNENDGGKPKYSGKNLS